MPCVLRAGSAVSTERNNTLIKWNRAGESRVNGAQISASVRASACERLICEFAMPVQENTGISREAT